MVSRTMFGCVRSSIINPRNLRNPPEIHHCARNFVLRGGDIPPPLASWPLTESWPPLFELAKLALYQNVISPNQEGGFHLRPNRARRMPSWPFVLVGCSELAWEGVGIESSNFILFSFLFFSFCYFSFFPFQLSENFDPAAFHSIFF